MRRIMEGRRVVVTGIGAVSPVGNTVNEAWNSLIEGRCGIGEITYFDTSAFKAKLDAEVKNFNPRDWMEKQDMLRSDRYVHFAMASSVEAVNDSGIEGTIEPERFAVYYGSGIGGIITFTSEMRKLIERGPGRVSPFLIPMMIPNMAAGMLAIRFGCKGAALPAVTACASGSNAIGEAVRAIRHGYADAVITGGAEAAISDLGVAGFQNMQALSISTDPAAASLPFDRRRAGFVIGEGAATLVLEEYERAKKRGAHIYGEVVGYGSTCDAYHITAPSPDSDGGKRAIEEALKEAAKVLRSLGYNDEADVVENHMHYDFPKEGDPDETDIVCLADRLVCEDEYVGLDRRLDYLINKPGKTEERTRRLLEKKKDTEDFISRIEEKMGCTIDSLFAED